MVRLLIALVVVRLLEFAPLLMEIRPGLLLTVGSVLYLWSRVPAEARRALFHAPLFRLPLAYLLWAVASVPFALWPGGALDSTRILLVGLLIVVVILLARGPAQVLADDLIRTFTLASLVFAVLLFSQGVEVSPGRFGVSYTLDSNDAAALFTVGVAFALGLARRARSPIQWVWLSAVCFLLLAIVRTGSRGGTLAVLVAVGVFVLGLHGGKKLAYGVLAAVLTLGVWSTASPEYRERMAALARGEQDYNYSAYAGRKQVWERGWGYWRENPVVGVGAGNFGVAEGGRLAESSMTGKWSAAHNSYVQAFAELGTPGGLLFLAMLGMAGRIGFRAWRPSGNPRQHRPEFLAGLAGFATGAYFLTHAYSFTLFALLGLATLLQRASLEAGGGGLTDPGRGPATEAGMDRGTAGGWRAAPIPVRAIARNPA